MSNLDALTIQIKSKSRVQVNFTICNKRSGNILFKYPPTVEEINQTTTLNQPFQIEFTCADPGIFVRGGGGPGQSNKKSSDNVFFCFFFLVLSLFYRSQMVNFKEIYHFSRFQRGSNIFQGGGGAGPTFSRGGSNCLFPIEAHITCEFSRRGGVRTPCPPSGSALDLLSCQLRVTVRATFRIGLKRYLLT